ncbi:MAG: hypothetical protein V2B19_01450 [Pseudomonadota bacterium]
MIDVSDKIQEIARRLLVEGRVDKIIGYRKGSLPNTLPQLKTNLT